jgi:Trypsin-like peptidase domain/Effector-associated domain 1
MAQIPGELLEGIAEAVTGSFTAKELARVLRYRMNVRLARIVAPGSLDDVVGDLLDWAERESRDADLVRVLAQAKPRNAALQTYYRQIGMAVPVAVATAGVPAARAPVDVGDPGLQALVRSRLPSVDFLKWHDRLAQVEARVCRVTIEGHSAGTGFLIGPQAVLTNYHVLKTVIEKTTPDAKVQCVFDYKLLATGARSGTVIDLAGADWLVDSSPPTPGEEAEDPDRTLPTAEQLDYAVVRLAEPVGQARGWERVPSADPTLQPVMALLIPQHPDGQPLKLAVDTEAINQKTEFRLNDNGTRIRYAVNTDRGASGSPCFDMNWNLLAVHHYGDAGYGRHLGYNQGVPVGPIGRRLRDPGRDPKTVQAVKEVVA